MSSQLKRLIPVTMVAGGVVMLVSLITASMLLQGAKTDDGVTRAAVERAIRPVIEKRYHGSDDPAVTTSVDEVAPMRYVSAVWLFTSDGRPVVGRGCIDEAAVSNLQGGSEVKSVLSGLPDRLLDADQKGAILALAAMRAEGEHNDVFRQIVRPLKGDRGNTVAWLAIAYAASPALSMSPALSWKLLVLAIPLGAIVYKLSLLSWIFWDARERGERAWVWASFALLGDLVALIAYVLVRSPLRPTTGTAK